MREGGAGKAPPYAAAIRVRSGGQETTGSGVLVDPHHVLTCAHVLADIDPGNAARPLRRSFDEEVASGWGSNTGRTVTEVAVGLDRLQPGGWRRASYVAEDTIYDLAVLRLDRPVYGVVPPFVHARRLPGERRIAFGYQVGEIQRCDLEIAVQAVHRGQDEGAPLSITIDSGLPAGFSGGPLIAVDERGRHWLDGVSVLGGMASPIGMATGTGPVMALLAKALDWRPASEFELADPVAPPGIAPVFCVPAGAAGSLDFRWCRSFFRAERPLSAAQWHRLSGEPERPGADRLPAHFPDSMEARDALGRLEAAAGLRLRLPKAEELAALAAEEDAPPFFGTNLALMSHYARAPEAAAPLPGTAEWALEDGRWCGLARRPGRDLLRPLEVVSGESAASPHLRFVLRPVFGMEP